MNTSIWHRDNAEAVVAEARNLIKKQLPQASRRQFLARGSPGRLGVAQWVQHRRQPHCRSSVDAYLAFQRSGAGWLFDSSRLAPTYPDSMITRPFPFNAFYDESKVPEVDASSFLLEVTGLVANKRRWTLDELRALPQYAQVTRHICVEGWSAIGKWGGPRFGDFLRAVGADLSARYVGFQCADDYYTSIDMATALHPQTLLALDWDGQPLPPKYGFPMKLRMPTKLGYKNPKHIQAIFVSNTFNRGYWEDQGYNWFGGS
jgi:DMSO/TMAO reductase YedYZ molybdopterin-dependent catalytic subunit